MYLCNMISQILQQWHIEGLVIGLATFLIIGVFHPLVIKGEYHFGTRCWRWFLALGIVMCVLSVLIENTIGSILSGVVAFSAFWSIKEVFEQEERVRKGWFPRNPRRNDYRFSEPEAARKPQPKQPQR